MRRSLPTHKWFCGLFAAVSCVVPLVMLSGCANTKPKLLTPEKASQLKMGVSTKADVIEVLGLPHKREVKTADDGQKREYLIYYSGRGESHTTYHIPLTFAAIPVAETSTYVVEAIPIWGLSISKEETEKVGLILVLDERGIVIDSAKGGE